jgi:2-C-methyl-D-erythritol 4-phosphate cytidylyltransferase/2-C-methyl-D-erythritol 2,4-cyclodiphosphate synthase
MSLWAIIAAAGSGSRMGGDKVKTLQTLAGRAVISYSVQALQEVCRGIIIAAREEDIPAFQQALAQDGLTVDIYVKGGCERRHSVENAMRALPPDCDIVLVHDGARPLCSRALISRVADSARLYGSGVPALPLLDTVKRVDDHGLAVETLDRQTLRQVQTPQGFSRDLLERAYSRVKGPAADDASLVEALGEPVHLVMGEMNNIKLTLPGDLQRALDILRCPQPPRVGFGYDVHRLVAGRPLILCGVTIPFDKGLLGHSDADVATHALIDALLGAAGLPDIGSQFPDSDMRYKGISSLDLLKNTCLLLSNAGFMPYNVDITIAAQAPKLAPFVPQMRRHLAACLEIPEGRVSVKATTTEGLGFEGEGLGISARGVALVQAAAKQEEPDIIS